MTAWWSDENGHPVATTLVASDDCDGQCGLIIIIFSKVRNLLRIHSCEEESQVDCCEIWWNMDSCIILWVSDSSHPVVGVEQYADYLWRI